MENVERMLRIILHSFTQKLWLVPLSLSNSHHRGISNYHDAGPIVRVAPNQVSVASATAMHQICSPSKSFSKTEFYTVFPPPHPRNLFNEIDKNLHAQQARASVHYLSMSAMQRLAPWIEKTEAHFIQKLDALINQNQPLNFPEWLHFFSFDVCIVFTRVVKTLIKSHHRYLGKSPFRDRSDSLKPARISTVVSPLSTNLKLITS